MNVLLTHGYFIQDDPKEQKIMRPYPPLGLLYVSAWLEKHGYYNEVFDSTFSSFDTLKGRLLQSPPDVLAIYTNLMTKLNVLKIIELVRSNEVLKSTKIVLGGPEVRNHKENFLRSGADVLVLGEGEETMLELVKCYDQNKGIEGVQSIAYLKGDGVMETPERMLMKDLDELPLPNRAKIDMQAYFSAWKNKHGESAISINTMRGCPYTCKWCSRAVYGLSYRRRSPKHVVDEIEAIQRDYEVDSAWFVDDVFTVSHKWLQGFVEELESKNVMLPLSALPGQIV